MDFGSLITAMVTPFKADGSVNYSKAQELARYLADHGSDGLVVSGTTGESPTLSYQEKLDLFKAVKEAVGKDVQVIAGTGDNETKTSIELTEAAAKTGVDGFLLVAPYYNKPSQEGLYQHFKHVAECTDLPVVLYNIPPRTSVNMLPETVERLAAIKNIVAIKEAAGIMDQVTELRARLGENFAIYSGDDALTLPLMSLGGYGIISVCAHIVGNKIKTMIDAFKAGNIQEALQLHLELYPIFKGMFITTNPVPIKAAMNLMGWDLGGFRLPMVDPTEKEMETIKTLLMEHNLIG